MILRVDNLSKDAFGVYRIFRRHRAARNDRHDHERADLDETSDGPPASRLERAKRQSGHVEREHVREYYEKRRTLAEQGVGGHRFGVAVGFR